MSANFQDLVTLVAAAAAAGLVLSLWAAAAVLWLRQRAARGKRIQERLGLVVPTESDRRRVLRLWHDGREATTTVPRLTPWLSLRPRLVRLCEEAGWAAPAPAILTGVGVVAAIFLVLMRLLTGSLMAAGSAGAAIVVTFYLLAKYLAGRRAARFDHQFVDALQVATRSLRAGYPLVGAFRLISEEIGVPVGELFGQICQQQALGMRLEDAIRQVASPSTSADMKLFATSVVIQLRSGGNLAEMMDRLAAVIRDRIRLNRRIRVLLAQIQLSKWILLALPLVLFIVLNILNPNYMEPFYATMAGQVLLLLAAAGLILGAWIMNRLSRLRY